MKKITVLLLLSLLLFSCFEEEAPSGFLSNTVWEIKNSGALLEGGSFLGSYLETHTLTFSQNTFTYSINRKETVGTDPSYQDKINEQTDGTYTVKYPEITLTSKTYVKVGTLSTNVLIVDADAEEPLFFTRKKQ
jgi:hypothetical protein